MLDHSFDHSSKDDHITSQFLYKNCDVVIL